MAKRAVIVVAGGTGKRMGGDVPKQFLVLGKLPILLYSLQAFADYDPQMQLILVLPAEFQAYWQKLRTQYNFSIEHQIVSGGTERFHSVKNGLAALNPEVDLVAIHDAVRPLVSLETIDRAFKTAANSGSAIPVLPVVDSLRRLSDNNSDALNRKNVFTVQTPQVFKKELLLTSYNINYSDAFTDDASVVESKGYSLSFSEGNRENIKITTAADLQFAEKLLHHNL